LSAAPCHAEPDWASPVVGGKGGDSFVLRCPAGQFLVGLNIRLGDDLDAVAPVCAAPREGGRSELLGLAERGGAGGEPRELLCPEGRPFVRELEVQAEGRATVLVNALQLHCGPLRGALMSQKVEGYDTLYAAGPYLWDWCTLPAGCAKKLMCPSHMAVVGVHGRAGLMIDGLGIVCATVPTPRIVRVFGGPIRSRSHAP
jgi:hypothetical protein